MGEKLNFYHHNTYTHVYSLSYVHYSAIRLQDIATVCLHMRYIVNVVCLSKLTSYSLAFMYGGMGSLAHAYSLASGSPSCIIHLCVPLVAVLCCIEQAIKGHSSSLRPIYSPIHSLIRY